ncbi:MAG: sterol desaturase [Sphingobacteriales bacterium 17-39-43]|uniref:sterol desaturase family protein n=1 Tax=Daejeonella sp. TaxID=2805397 RepID=UPI000BD39E02|nr:sterol desaturase family protein [Daejeonella sp.]OYZ29833.1 MAG: sterol desaturase [Sphingobacteriales bacterium 16-39-50]OZA22693.1 MAG: sterol desaturase [Sphingobacteriales bacterium 17-39-43]HQT24347.1 sterol desaturase family protein [Daejeonella sp.]HQT59140.1 sterol desaturase family protein [Daejeonella sp.]
MKVDYIALSIPVFFILIAVELGYALYKKLDYYRLNDSLSNLSQGIGSQLVGIFLKTITFFSYLFIYEHWRFYTFPNTLLTWILLFLGVDFFYYWFHRKSHQINALWAAHIVHHQSEEYNLTVALRQSWFQSGFAWVFYLPLAFAGFEPIMFLTVSAFNTIYQFWIHTRAIGRMGPLEWFLNTPSHHRVHHGSNPKYIDKNHAGTLIIWDRMFGTFQNEEEEVVYGITKPLASWNPVWANFHYWADLYSSSKNARTYTDKIKIFIKAPGWFPDYLGGVQHPKEIEISNYVKYSPDYDQRFKKYILITFLFTLSLSSLLIFINSELSSLQLIACSLLSILSLTSCGVLMEQRNWSHWFENVRILIWTLVPLTFYGNTFFSNLIIINTIAALLSFAWFNRIKRNKYV